jgi:hypothetical protein
MIVLTKAADECRQILTEQQISPGRPGSILTDIQAMIEFIGVGGIPTQSAQGNLPTKVLPELNARLSQPLELNLKRPFLRDYPNLAGPYVLLRVMDLVRVDERRVWINDEALALWSTLNPTEKYFALLEAWLLHADDDVLSENQRPPPLHSQFGSNLNFLASTLGSKWKSFDEYCHLDGWGGGVSAWNAQLQARFGLIEMQPRPVEGRRSGSQGWLMAKARRTPWGKAVAWALLEASRVEEEAEVFFHDLPEDAGFGFLRPAFQPYFPEWQKIFSLTLAASRPGLYIFKASLDPSYYGAGQPWRRLTVPDRTSLDELAWAVLEAFRFDDTEHLYEFKFRDCFGKTRTYSHPYSEEGPYADQITLGEINIPEKGTLNFLFDFGDSWQFVLRLEKINPPDRKLRRPKVIGSGGTPPKQYPDSDWE